MALAMRNLNSSGRHTRSDDVLEQKGEYLTEYYDARSFLVRPDWSNDKIWDVSWMGWGNPRKYNRFREHFPNLPNTIYVPNYVQGRKFDDDESTIAFVEGGGVFREETHSPEDDAVAEFPQEDSVGENSDDYHQGHIFPGDEQVDARPEENQEDGLAETVSVVANVSIGSSPGRSVGHSRPSRAGQDKELNEEEDSSLDSDPTWNPPDEGDDSSSEDSLGNFHGRGRNDGGPLFSWRIWNREFGKTEREDSPVNTVPDFYPQSSLDRNGGTRL
jgi:hypothetical protein